MVAKGNKLESTLVSMAGTFIYLHDLSSTLAAKPIIPQAVSTDMPDTQADVAALKAQFERAFSTARREAQPFLDEWLRQVGLQIGGGLRGVTISRLFGREELSFEGGIETAQLHHHLVHSGVRVVNFTLVDARIRLSDGSRIDRLSDLARLRGHYELTALRDHVTKDPKTGAESYALQVRVPIQARTRSNWASGELVLK